MSETQSIMFLSFVAVFLAGVLVGGGILWFWFVHAAYRNLLRGENPFAEPANRLNNLMDNLDN